MICFIFARFYFLITVCVLTKGRYNDILLRDKAISEKEKIMGKFDGILFCTDLDGTLVNSKGEISEENIRAIEYFKSEGGMFTFVTGRMPFYARRFYDIIKPNAPIGCVNGGGLYDYAAEKYIWTSVMPEGVTTLIKLIDDKFDNVGIQVNTFYKTYFCKENDVMENFRKGTGLENLVCRYDKVSEPIAKIIFGSNDNEEILEIERTLKAHPLADNFDFIRSERKLYEILPKGVCKGVSITKLSEKLGIDINKTIAIGDYNNDISMFRAAKVGIAVANACPDALAAADYVTVSNDEHAIARVIYDLSEGKFF